VLGYCVAPLNIAALISSFVRIIYVRAPVSLAAWAWCVWGAYLLSTPARASADAVRPAAMNFFDGSKIEQQRILLAVYPLLCVPCLGTHTQHLTDVTRAGCSTLFWPG
jgi:hypothetical protein